MDLPNLEAKNKRLDIIIEEMKDIDPREFGLVSRLMDRKFTPENYYGKRSKIRRQNGLSERGLHRILLYHLLKSYGSLVFLVKSCGVEDYFFREVDRFTSDHEFEWPLPPIILTKAMIREDTVDYVKAQYSKRRGITETFVRLIGNVITLEDTIRTDENLSAFLDFLNWHYTQLGHDDFFHSRLFQLSHNPSKFIEMIKYLRVCGVKLADSAIDNGVRFFCGNVDLYDLHPEAVMTMALYDEQTQKIISGLLNSVDNNPNLRPGVCKEGLDLLRLHEVREVYGLYRGGAREKVIGQLAYDMMCSGNDFSRGSLSQYKRDFLVQSLNNTYGKRSKKN